MSDELDRVALFRHFPALRDRLPWVVLGDWATPLEPLDELARAVGYAGGLYVKREDLSCAAFGGNKVRTLESLFGDAVRRDADRIWTTGAFGSNHACAMAYCAGRAGLAAGALVFPQPPTPTAAGNLRALAASGCQIRALANIALLPLGMHALARESARGGEHHYVMPPGGATPRGALAHVSAALELAEQVRDGVCPPPARLVLAAGSTCTAAGLLVGSRVAARLGIGLRAAPLVTAVRVTPWPVTDRRRIAFLAWRTSRLLASLVGDVGAVTYGELYGALDVEPRFFGGGYGAPTAAGLEARKLFRNAGGPPLDQVYTEKSAAALLALARAGVPGPLVFWATRTSAPLREPTAAQLARLPPRARAWLHEPKRNA